MNRRSFLKRAGLGAAGVAIAPSLLPDCKECGKRLFLELLNGETDLCAECRAKHKTIFVMPGLPAVSDGDLIVIANNWDDAMDYVAKHGVGKDVRYVISRVVPYGTVYKMDEAGYESHSKLPYDITGRRFYAGASIQKVPDTAYKGTHTRLLRRSLQG